MITSLTFDGISPEYLTTLELKRLIGFVNEINIKCTLFVVPSGYENRSTNGEFVSCLKTALDYGHELALHGYMHTKNEFGCCYPVPLPLPFPTFRKQKERLEKGMRRLMDLTGVKPLGFRAPFYLHNNVTLRALSSLGFRYDSSATVFKPAHGMHLRIRWLRDCMPFVSQGIIELPVTGDYTYSLRDRDFLDFLGGAIRDFEWIKSCHGVFVLNNHPQRLSETGYHFLRALINKLSKSTKIVRLCDVAKMRF